MVKPYAWTPEIEDEIFTRIAKGEAIHVICGDDWLPSLTPMYRRLAEDEDFRERYARARELQADREFDEIRQIADDAKPDDVQVARLRIDARKWRASKLKPKVYGDKLELGGNVGLTVTLESDADKL